MTQPGVPTGSDAANEPSYFHPDDVRRVTNPGGITIGYEVKNAETDKALAQLRAHQDYRPAPEHYEGDGMQPWDIIDAYGLDFYEGNVVKYLLRWRKKDGNADLLKARDYLNKLIEREGAA